MTNPKSKIQNPKSLWWMAQLAVLIFPIMPTLGAFPLVAAMLGMGKQQLKTIIRRPLNWVIAILSIWLILIASVAFKPTEALLGLANYLPWFLFFVTFSELIKTPKQLRRLAWILVLPSVPIVFLGLGQVFLGWGIGGEVAHSIGFAIAPSGNPPGRIASVFMYANIFAAYLSIVLILALGLLIEYWQQTKNIPPPPLSPSPPPPLLYLIVAVISSAIALILTNSRNGWGVAVLASVVFAVYLGWRWLVAIVAAIVGGVLWSAFGPDPVRQWLRGIVPAFFWARLTDQLHSDRPIALMRVTQWQFAGGMIQQRPLTGWGLRNFTPLYESQMQLWLGHPHNLFLMFAAEMGITGAILFGTIVGWVLYKAVLLLRDWSGKDGDKLIFFSYLLAFGGCILFNTVDVTLYDARVNTLSWLLLAAICGVTRTVNTYHAE